MSERASAASRRPGHERGMRSRRAFTLVELLVALAVSALVVTAAFGAIPIVTGAAERASERGAAERRALAVRLALARWLRAAMVGADAEFRGVRHDGLAGRRDELSLVVADGAPIRPGPARLTLFLDADPATSAQGVVAVLAPLRANDPRRPDTLTLAPGATGLAARYRVAGRGRAAWADRWVSRELVPEGIELRMIHAPAARAGDAALMSLPIVVSVEGEGW